MKQQYTLKYIADHSNDWYYQTYEEMMEDVMEYKTDEYYMNDNALYDYLESSMVLMDEYYSVDRVEKLNDGSFKAIITNEEFDDLATEIIFKP